MHVPHRLKLFLRKMCIIVFHVNSQRLLIIYQEPMNVMKVITEIPFTGKEKVMLPYLIRGNQPDNTDLQARRKGENCDLARYYLSRTSVR
jgi:hypothetical protein